MASNTGEFDLNVLLDGHLSVALGKVLVKYTTNKTSMTPLWSRSQTRYAEDFVKWAEVAGVNVITTHPYSVWGALSNLANAVVAGDSAGDEPHVAAAPWRAQPPLPPVLTKTRVISESRCRTKLHGIFKKAQRHSKDSRCFLLLGGSDQLVGSQVARLPSLRVVILNEVLSPDFGLNSSIVRDVLRGWIAHGAIAAVWKTQPLTLSTAACLPEACHQANVVGCYAVLNSDMPRQSLERWATNNFVFQQVPVDLCAFGLPFMKRFTLFSVNVPVHLQLARRCDNSGHVCSFAGKADRQLGSCFQNRFFHRSHRVRCAIFVARALLFSFHAKDSWTNKQRWLG